MKVVENAQRIASRMLRTIAHAIGEARTGIVSKDLPNGITMAIRSKARGESTL
jgi:hypothetical protein